ncbi:MAG: hypothetical protein NTV32_07905 [Gammaproteobacteria bacterium]|nr:hypothetical protein [Gammaproteobacteria bacterium]
MSDSKNIKMLFAGIILFYILWQIGQFFYGERVLAGGGFGWDGVQYATWVSQFSFRNYFQHQLSPYYIQRILPSIIVHYIMVILHLNLQSHSAIINTFIVYNNVMLLFVMLGLFSLAYFLRWTPAATLVAFVSLFFNFVLLKQLSYYSVLTDYTALTIGFFQLYCYIKKRVLFLYLLSIVGAFAWPTLLLSGFLLILFDAQCFKKDYADSLIDFMKRNFSYKKCAAIFVLSVIFSVLFAAICFFLYKMSPDHHKFLTLLNVLFSNISYGSILPWWVVVSIFVVLIYVFFLVLPAGMLLLRALSGLKRDFIFWIKLGLCVVFYGAIHFIVSHYSLHTIAEPGLSGFLFRFVFAIAAPGKFLATYFIYFGLGAVLLVFLLPRISFQDIAPLGIPYFLLLLIFALQVHSRFGTPYFPLIALMIGTQLSKMKISFQFCLRYVLLAFVFSCAWIPLTWPGQSLNPTMAELHQWPWQVYFATSGLWTTSFSYSIELVLMIIAGFLVYPLLKNKMD